MDRGGELPAGRARPRHGRMDEGHGGDGRGSSGDAGEVTRLLAAVEAGEQGALDRLAGAVYGDLKALGRRHLQRERRDHTLQPTAIVHEAFVRLVAQRDVTWRGRAHFFAIAGRLMRRILVDAARARAARVQGSRERESLSGLQVEAQGVPTDLVSLDGALDRLAEVDAQAARVIELRFFADQSHAEAAEVLGISERAVRRSFQFAKAWLYRYLEAERG